MADDAARIAQLEAENAALREREGMLVGQVEQRDRALAQAHEQQTATAEVLRVIASAPTDGGAALQTITEAAARLCDASGGSLAQVRPSDGRLAPRATYGGQRERVARLYGDPFSEAPGIMPIRDTPPGLALVEGRTIQVEDLADAVQIGRAHV